jgi:hypothetical protein
MTDTTDTDLAQALRKLHQRWLDLSTACISPSYVLEECASEVEAVLALHDAARAQPAPSVADYFDKLRRDDNHHLGLGDVRLTLGQQEDVVQMAARAQPASVADVPQDVREEYEIFRNDLKRYSDGDPKFDFHALRITMASLCEVMDKWLAAAPQPAKDSDNVK